MRWDEHRPLFRLRRAIRAAAVGCLVLTQATCRLDELLRAPPPANIQVVIAGDTVAVADTSRLRAKVLVNGEEQTGIRLTWSPRDAAVATVDSAGVVRGVGRGRAGISVTLPRGALVGAQIEVTDTVWVVAAGLALAPLDTVLQSVDDTLCLRPTARDARGNALAGAVPAFRIIGDADSTIRQAGGSGCVIARKSGAMAAVEMTLDTSTSTTGVRVLQRVASVAIPASGGPLFSLGATVPLSATARDRRGNFVPGAAVSWSSSDATVLTVDANGQATARGEGSARVHAQADDGRDSVTIAVTPPRLVVSLDTAKAVASEGNTRLRTVKVAIANQGTGSLAWSATGAGAWLSLSKTSGTAPDTVTLTFDPAALTADTYLQSLVITSPGSAGSPRTVPAIFAIAPPTTPAAPQSLTQVRTDGATVIADTTDQTSAILRAIVADADSDAAVVLEVEIRPLGTAFTDIPTGASGSLASGQTAAVTASGLTEDTGYHWQARARDETGRFSAWTSFGANAEAAADLRVAIPENPGAPSALGQFQSDGTPVPAGSDLTATSMQLKATVADPDPGDRLRLEVELERVGTGFDGTGTVFSSELASGTVATVSASGIPDDANYHWRSRVVDQTGRAGPWVSFPEAPPNLETAADFHVPSLPEAPDPPIDADQFQSNGSTPVPVGGVAFQSTVVLKARLTDSDPGDQLTFEVEARPLGTAFSNTATATGSTVASGGTASVTIPGLIEDAPYHWQFRAVDQTLRTSPWVSFGGNGETSTDFHVAIPQDPNAPTALGQFKSDGSSGIGIGSTTDERTTVFAATAVDPDPGDQVRLELETKPLVVPFNGAGTVLGPLVASGSQAAATVAGQADDQSYHWQARTVDQTGRVSAWVSFGGNTEADTDYRIVAPEPPAFAESAQFKSNGTTGITLGATTDENTVVLQARLGDPDPGDQARLEVEVKPAGTAFDGAGTLTSGLVPSNAIATVTVPGLGDDGDYHWRLRAADQTSRVSAWESFGGNAESAADFHVAVPQDPGAPAGLGQFKSDGSTPIPGAATTDQSSVVFRATVTDSDPGDQLQLEVEVQPVGTAFTNTATATGVAVASGLGASVSVEPLSDNTNYHWQVRTRDQTGRTSSWVAFGVGGVDVRVDVPGAPDSPTTLQQFRSDGTTVIANGATTDQSTVVFSAAVSDPDGGDQVRLEVEVKPAATGFAGSNTATGALGANPGTATVTVNGLGDDADYHWRARAVDQNGNASAWVEFPAAGTDFRVQIPQAPAVPAALAQLKSNGTTPIATGATTDQNTVVLQAAIGDPDPTDQVRLDIEIQPTGQPFSNSPTNSSALGANGTVQVTVGGLSDDTHYHWQARSRDNGGTFSNWVSFGGNSDGVTADPDVRIAVPQPPVSPAGPGQFKSNGTTAFAAGATTDENTVVFKATLNDPDPDAQVLLDLEVRLIGDPFTGTTTHSANLGAPGLAQLTVSGLSEDTDYHWRARTRDQSGLESAWVSFGGNADGVADFHVAVPQPPANPMSLAQFKLDGTTPIATGATTDQTTVVFQTAISDPDPGDQVRLDIEVRPVGQSFTDAPTHSGVLGANGTVQVTVAGLSDNTPYHWQARTRDAAGSVSGWVTFGGNAESAADFITDVAQEAPGVPTGAGQFKSNGITAIVTGATTDESTVVFQASVTDADPGAQVRLEVERQALGTGFSNTPTATGGTAVASGQVASVSVSVHADPESYHWQVRAIDQNNNPGGWVSFGANAEGAIDYRVEVQAPPNPPANPAQFRSNGITGISTAATTDETTVIFKADLTDSPPAQSVRLEVEVKPIGVAFNGAGTDTSAAVASGSLATLTKAGLSDDVSYHWRARTLGGTARTSAWVNFGGNSEGPPAATDFAIAVPQNPAAPNLGDISQRRPSGTLTAIAVGDTTKSDSIRFRVLVTDPDPGDQVRFEAEWKLVGSGFTGTGTIVSPLVTSGNTVDTIVTGLADNSAYHWRVRTIDQTGRMSAWVPFGGNNDPGDTDFRSWKPENPGSPTGIAQTSDGTTTIALGAVITNQQVIFRAGVSDPDPGDSIQLWVERRPVGEAFQNVFTHTGPFFASGGTATLTISTQDDNTSYHWQVRAVDELGNRSAWVPFGANPETNADYTVNSVLQNPSPAPTSLGQFESNGTTVVPDGGNLGVGALGGNLSLVFKATVFDVDPGDALHVEVEVKPVGTAFSNVPNGVGSATASTGNQASVTATPPNQPGLGATVNYHWQARTCDQTGRCSGWVPYPAPDPDFSITRNLL